MNNQSSHPLAHKLKVTLILAAITVTLISFTLLSITIVSMQNQVQVCFIGTCNTQQIQTSK